VSRIALRSIVVAAALAALAPAGAHAATQSEGFAASLTRPAVVDGVRLSAEQVKQRFAGKPLYFVLGSREEAAGAAAAFTTPAKRTAYLKRTGRSHHRKTAGARASYNGYESVLYEGPFLEGDSISVGHGNALGNLASNPLPWRPWASWDNHIASAKTGFWGARLYAWPFLNAGGGTIDIPGYDSVEIFKFFGYETSSIMNF
jgi:hypothetical protein